MSGDQGFGCQPRSLVCLNHSNVTIECFRQALCIIARHALRTCDNAKRSGTIRLRAAILSVHFLNVFRLDSPRGDPHSRDIIGAFPPGIRWLRAQDSRLISRNNGSHARQPHRCREHAKRCLRPLRVAWRQRSERGRQPDAAARRAKRQGSRKQNAAHRLNNVSGPGNKV